MMTDILLTRPGMGINHPTPNIAEAFLKQFLKEFADLEPNAKNAPRRAMLRDACLGVLDKRGDLSGCGRSLSETIMNTLDPEMISRLPPDQRWLDYDALNRASDAQFIALVDIGLHLSGIGGTRDCHMLNTVLRRMAPGPDAKLEAAIEAWFGARNYACCATWLSQTPGVDTDHIRKLMLRMIRAAIANLNSSGLTYDNFNFFQMIGHLDPQAIALCLAAGLEISEKKKGFIVEHPLTQDSTRRILANNHIQLALHGLGRDFDSCLSRAGVSEVQRLLQPITEPGTQIAETA